MPKFLNTTGNTTLAIGICARCKRKFPLGELMSDPNFPALYVCREDLDQLDPYRLPAREAERIDVDHPRPDAILWPIAPFPLQTTQQFDGVTQIQQPVVWSALTPYQVNQQVTPGNPVGLAAAGAEIFVYVCIAAGTSGAARPKFPLFQGVSVQDGGVTWVNAGLYLP